MFLKFFKFLNLRCKNTKKNNTIHLFYFKIFFIFLLCFFYIFANLKKRYKKLFNSVLIKYIKLCATKD